jgi:hypothetical protein
MGNRIVQSMAFVLARSVPTQPLLEQQEDKAPLHWYGAFGADGSYQQSGEKDGVNFQPEHPIRPVLGREPHFNAFCSSELNPASGSLSTKRQPCRMHPKQGFCPGNPNSSKEIGDLHWGPRLSVRQTQGHHQLPSYSTFSCVEFACTVYTELRPESTCGIQGQQRCCVALYYRYLGARWTQEKYFWHPDNFQNPLGELHCGNPQLGPDVQTSSP